MHLVGLSGADYKKYRTILQAKHRIAENQKSAAKGTGDREIGDFGETETKQYRQQQKRLSPAETAMVVQGYQSGKTTYQLAGEFDCHHQTISNILKRHNIKVDKRKAQKKLNADVVVAMYIDGHSSTEIGKRFDVSPQVVLRCLRNHGVEIRSRGNQAHSTRI